MDPSAPRKPAKQGILLFEQSPKPRRYSYKSNPSSKPSSAGSRPANVPHDSGNVRTNFTSMGSSAAQSAHSTAVLGNYEAYAFDTPDEDVPKLDKPRDHDLPAPQFQSLYVVLAAFLGIALGFGMYYLHIGSEWQKIIALPGDLFVRALRCLIVPLVFCVMTIVVAEAVALGRSSIMRLRTLLPYLASSVLSTVQGMILALLFKNYFIPKSISHTAAASGRAAFNMTLQCANGLFLSALPNGAGLGCVGTNATDTSSLFLALNETVASAAAASADAAVVHLSLVDQIIGITNLLVPVNIFSTLVNGDLLSIVMFSIPLGFAMAHSTQEGHENVALQLFKQVRSIFVLLLNGLLTVTPIAVVFLMGGAIAKFDAQDLSEVMSQMGYLFMAFMIGAVSHALICLPLLMFLWIRINPYAYIQQLIPAYVFAFGCSSSMATLPVAIECIQRARVSRSLAHITMPFGTPVNLNASGIYYPLAVVFMANMSGAGSDLTTARYVVLFFVSLLGCMGTAPVPNAALVYILTLWKTVFPDYPLPLAFSLIVTADFLLDRVSTVLNVNGNAMVTRILAEQIDETFEVQAEQYA
ncbi:Aste57867_17393 [Aphanomyces stellatus]|uniref:Amino acid transporter n=1 Tax=Aphanomyces stellatus TaxID=120398 RepID=A0A485LB90_9STRA|nr:hypothetical protein As57867_017333 [Aphanomyces stellatus]VFT94149.1 Aste57867_17393 [Aphanomyces stellatus]